MSRLVHYMPSGLVPILSDETVEEVYRTSGGDVFVLGQEGRQLLEGILWSKSDASLFINAAADRQGVTLPKGAGSLEADLPVGGVFRGARLSAFREPVAPGPAINIRLPPTRQIALSEYVERGMLSKAWRDVLIEGLKARENILVAGGPGTGKTTLMRALLHEISAVASKDHTLILEERAEILPPSAWSDVRRTVGDMKLRQLVQRILRISFDRLVVGEVRGEEARDMVAVWQTGFPGGLASVHGKDATEALERLDELCKWTGPSQARNIAKTIGMVVVLAGRGPERRVSEIARLTGLSQGGEFELSFPSDGL